VQKRSEHIITHKVRITDHRTKQSWFNLEEILNGNLENIIEEISTEIRNLTNPAELEKKDE
jgi:protein subunit release factor A